MGAGLAGVRGFQEPVGAGEGVLVWGGVGVGVVGPVGTGLGDGAGWDGTGLEGTGTGVRLGGSADGTAGTGTAGTWTEIDGAGALDGTTAAGPCGECCAGSAAVWPDLALGVAAVGDAAALGEVLGVVDGAPDCVEPWLSALAASWARDSWPKKGNSRAWPKEPAANKMPNAPVTTAIRLLMVRTAAAFLRTACGSRLKDEPVNDAGPTPGRSAAGISVAAAFSALVDSAVARARVAADTVGMAAVAGSDGAGTIAGAATVGMAAVAGSAGSAATVGAVTVGMAAVSLAWEARFRSAARAAARVVGAAVVGVAAGVGAAVELKGSEAGAAMNGSLSLARRRPVALVLSPATWARRG
ncbi:hypothetical protein ACSVHC_12115 [Arthrobacter sp. KNU-44]|uniref:hypothetical protein n=1 Tax=Arthrobacter sp. KNU-44 TaxID=3450744 RepID=UPI003F41EA8B